MAAAAAVVVLGVCASLLEGRKLEELRDHDAQSRFETNVERVEKKLDERLQRYVRALTAVRALLHASDLVDGDEFRTFLADARLVDDCPGAICFGFLRRIAATGGESRDPDTIRIMLTGQASLEAVIQAINEGRVYRFLTKPCSPLQLAQTLRDALTFLDLTREGSRLLAAVKRQRELLTEIERRHPGITSVERADDGSILLSDDTDAAELLLAMRAETAQFEREPG